MIDLNIPGWVVSAANVESLLDTIKGTDIPPNARIIFDLFGNSFCRWSQEDGTEALAVKTGSGYHLPGRVSVCSEEVFVKLIENTLPLLFELQRNSKIILPPLPRYLFRGCCPEYGHASNVSEDGYQDGMLEGLARLRYILKKQIVSVGLEKAWVGEGVRDLVPPSVKDKDGIIVCLRESCMADGVHFTDDGYATLASNIHCIMESRFAMCRESDSAAVSVSGRGGRSGAFYWRGSCPQWAVRVPGTRRPATNTCAAAVSHRMLMHSWRERIEDRRACADKVDTNGVHADEAVCATNWTTDLWGKCLHS